MDGLLYISEIGVITGILGLIKTNVPFFIRSLIILNLWMTEKTGETWGEPKKLDSNINTSSSNSWGEWHSYITNSGNIYFARDANIYFSKYTESGYEIAIKLASINSSSNDWDPYVDPEERYLIFKSNRPGGFGQIKSILKRFC